MLRGWIVDTIEAAMYNDSWDCPWRRRLARSCIHDRTGPP